VDVRIFIAGGTGVVGRRVVPFLVAARHQVTAIGRTSEKRAALDRQGATPVEASLFDPDQLRRAVADHDVVINLATSIPPPSRVLMPGAWRPNARIRGIGAPNLAAAAGAAGAKRLIQESFAPIYEDGADLWIDETSPIRPARYNRAVIDAERAATAFTGDSRAGVVLRFAYFYGPDSDFLQEAIAAVRKGWAPAFGPDTFISSISHDDVAAAVIAALDVPAGTYNVTDNEPVTKREFYRSLAAALDVPPPRFPPAWLSHLAGSLGETLARSQRMSNRKFRQASGWSPKSASVGDGWRDATRAAASPATR
jgi:nucleoside-diphosphate-sugar epimerase